MRKDLVLLFIGVVITGFCEGTSSKRLDRVRRAEPDFILRSCIASAQLTRKHRRNDPSQLLTETNNVSNLPSASLVLEDPKYKSPNNYGSNKRSRNDMRQRARGKGRHLITAKSTTDSPLGTIDVRPIRTDVPKAFRKKDPLPELDRKGAARNLNTDTPVIMVHALKPKIN